VIGSTANAGTRLPPVGTNPEWIVCFDAMRPVADGLVVCPRGIYAQWIHCLACRYLAVAEDDRTPNRFCSTDPPRRLDVKEGTVAPTSWAELVIELL
jgi:hypothetical protein